MSTTSALGLPLTFAAIILFATNPAAARTASSGAGNAPAPATDAAPAPGAAAQSDPASDPASSGGLAEIVVTAQKRSENMQKVPISVTAISGKALVNSGVTNTLQLGVAVPGVSIRNSTGSFQPFIRGVGTSTSLVENPIALYIDNVYYPVQREGVRDFVDLQQIAVLKGPQGTLFGRNATGGVVQITTRDPSIVRPELEVSTGLDNYLTSKSTAYVSTPVGPNSAFDVSGSFTTQGDGWGRDVTRNQDIYKIFHDGAVRAKLLLSDGDKFKAVIIGDYGNRRDNMLTFSVVPGTVPQYPGFTPLANPRDSEAAGPSNYFIKSGGVSANLGYDLGFARVVSISAYRQGVAGYTFDTVGDPYATIQNLQHQTWRSFSQELQLVSKGNGPLTWAAGVFYMRFRDKVDPFQQNFYGPASPLPTSTEVTYAYANELVNSVAGYAQATYQILSATKITAGIRYTYEKHDFIGSKLSETNTGPLTQTFTSADNPAFPNTITAKKPTWRLSVDQQLTPNALLYASYNRGFKSGGFNLNTPNNKPYLPEQIDAYEGGFKGEFLNHRVRLNLSGFYYNYKNMQVTSYVITGPVVTNGADAHMYGGEAEFEAQITDHLHFNSGLSLLHSEFADYPSATCSTPTPIPPKAPYTGIITHTCSAAGNRTPFSQRYVVTSGIDYDTRLADAKINFNATNSINDGFFTEADNRLYQPAFDLLNLSTTITPPGDHVSVRIWAVNVANKNVVTIAYTGSPRAYLETFGNPPRTVGFTVKYIM